MQIAGPDYPVVSDSGYLGFGPRTAAFYRCPGDADAVGSGITL